MSLFEAGEVLFLNVHTIKTRSLFISDGNTCAWLARILLAGGVVVGAMGVAAGTKTGKREPGRRLAGLGGRTRSSKDNGGDHGGPAASKPRAQLYVKGDREIPGRRSRPQNPGAIRSAQYPLTAPGANSNAPIPSAPQTIGTNFTGATLAETGSIPPDTMGAVGRRSSLSWSMENSEPSTRQPAWRTAFSTQTRTPSSLRS